MSASDPSCPRTDVNHTTRAVAPDEASKSCTSCGRSNLRSGRAGRWRTRCRELRRVIGCCVKLPRGRHSAQPVIGQTNSQRKGPRRMSSAQRSTSLRASICVRCSRLLARMAPIAAGDPTANTKAAQTVSLSAWVRLFRQSFSECPADSSLSEIGCVSFLMVSSQCATQKPRLLNMKRQ